MLIRNVGEGNQRDQIATHCPGAFIFNFTLTPDNRTLLLNDEPILPRAHPHIPTPLRACLIQVFSVVRSGYNRAGGAARLPAHICSYALHPAYQHFTSLYSHAREKAFTKRNIMAGWAACGLFPFNPDRVLRVTPKPPAQTTVARADEIVGACHQDDVPPTPVTPNEASIERLERHVQKLAHAARVSFAECAFLGAERALLDNRNQILIRMNNEAKVRRSTKSIILRKAKVINFEDIEVARQFTVQNSAKSCRVATEQKWMDFPINTSIQQTWGGRIALGDIWGMSVPYDNKGANVISGILKYKVCLIKTQIACSRAGPSTEDSIPC
jgi:hypothetical protein